MEILLVTGIKKKPTQNAKKPKKLLVIGSSLILRENLLYM